MAGFRIEGNVTGNVAEVTAANEIKVLPSDQVTGQTVKPAALDTSAGVVNLQSSQLFIDTFDASFDTTNNWNIATTGNAGVAFVFSTASITGGTGTTANGFSFTTSRQNFQPGNPGYLELQMNMGMPDGAAPVANSYLAWGLMTPQATPTTALPIVNGLVFERQTNGKMFVAVYQSGTRAVIQDLSSSGNNQQPLNASAHKYYMWIRGDIGFFAIDSRTNIVATFTTGALGPDITTLPVGCLCVGAATPPVSNVQLVNNMTCVGDTSQSTTTLSDPQFPFRQANIKAASTAAAATDLPLVVALHPTSPTPGVGQTSTTAGQTGLLVQGAVTTAAPAYTTAQTSPLSLTTTGALRAGIMNASGGATVLAASTAAAATDAPLVVAPHPLSPAAQPSTNQWVTATAAVNTAATATLPAGGAGLFHYITQIELVKLYNVAGVGSGAGIIITSTNMIGNPSWTTEQGAAAAGAAVTVIKFSFAGNPLKVAAANTVTTLVAPAELQTIWRWNVGYFLAP